jgi:hypothetical protein
MKNNDSVIDDLIIYDGFYENPERIREMALKLPFWVMGQFPGLRTEAVEGDLFYHLRDHLQNIMGKKISQWEGGYNSAFQYSLSEDASWIHHDNNNGWAAVVYLNPEAPKSAGTCFYKHKRTGIIKHQENQINFNDYVQDMEDWEEIERVDNVFNRAIIYRGNYYHRSAPEKFGINKWNGRLFQTFFFDTED